MCYQMQVPFICVILFSDIGQCFQPDGPFFRKYHSKTMFQVQKLVQPNDILNFKGAQAKKSKGIQPKTSQMTVIPESLINIALRELSRGPLIYPKSKFLNSYKTSNHKCLNRFIFMLYILSEHTIQHIKFVSLAFH